MNKPSEKIVEYAKVLSEYLDSFILELKKTEEETIFLEENRADIPDSDNK